VGRVGQDEGVQGQVWVVQLLLAFLDFSVEPELGVIEVEVADALRVDKAEPLLARRVIDQPEQEVGIEIPCPGEPQALGLRIGIAQQIEALSGEQLLGGW